MSKNKYIILLIIIVSLLLIVVVYLLFAVFYYNPQQQFYDETANQISDENQNIMQTASPAANYSGAQVADPAASYCIGLGYKYETKKDNGEIGVCVLPENIECDAWKFFSGQCGQGYTFCEKNGGKIATTDENCQFSPKCAVCILRNGAECNEWKYFKGKCP